jgi:predicted HicB family RNase H-like nuclease
MSAVKNGIKRITIRVPATLHKALAHAAIDRDTSLNWLAVEALEQYLATIKG